MAGRGCQWIRVRYQLSWLIFFGFLNVYMLRVNLSVALIAMVNTPNDDVHPSSDECPVVGNDTSSQGTNPKGATYDWDRTTQGLILGSFFYGYIVTQIPGGWLAGKYGSKKLFGVGVLCTAVFTLITPQAAQIGVPALVATRVLEGLGEGVTFPAIYSMWGLWAPPLERSKLACLSFSGAQFGTILGLPLSGLIIDQLGWPYIFYIFGAIGIVWFFFWMLLAADSPETHRYISQEEKEYIMNAISSDSSPDPITLKNTPWLEMAKSPALWAIICSNFCHNWGFYTLLTCLPTYMKDVLHYDISKDSLLSSLTYVFTFISVLVSCVLIDTARERGYVSTTHARKIANTIGMLGPAACLIGMSFVGCNYVIAVILLCLSGAFDGMSGCGYGVNHLDIAPRFAGTLMGITNTFGTIPGFLGPQVVGWLTTEPSTSAQWRSVFIISAEIYVFGVIIYLLLGSGVVQPWALRNCTNYEPLSTNNDNSISQDGANATAAEYSPEESS